jgi:hypothetical protein
MTKTKKPDNADIITRLLAIKMMAVGLKDAMPTAARELRRSICESVDDLVEDMAR